MLFVLKAFGYVINVLHVLFALVYGTCVPERFISYWIELERSQD